MCIITYTLSEVIVSTLPIRLSQASGVPFYRQVVDQLAREYQADQHQLQPLSAAQL